MIDTIKKFCELYPRISDLVDNAYSIDFSSHEEVTIQGRFNAGLTRNYSQQTAWKINSINGLIEGCIKVEDLSIGIVLT